MTKEARFNRGDKVQVVKNTERIPHASCIGMAGEVVETRFRDCLVKLLDGSLHGIIEDDLELCSR